MKCEHDFLTQPINCGKQEVPLSTSVPLARRICENCKSHDNQGSETLVHGDVKTQSTQYSVGKTVCVSYKSCGTQYESPVGVSQGTQCCFENIPVCVSSTQNIRAPVCSDCRIKCNVSSKKGICCVAPRTFEPISNREHKYKLKEVSGESSNVILNEELPISNKHDLDNEDGLSTKKVGEHKSKCFRKRRDTYSSSTTSGIAETSSTRSDLSQLNEDGINLKKNIKKRKKLLWDPSCDNSTLSDCDIPINYFYLESLKSKEVKSNLNESPKSVNNKYTNEEQLKIIKFIAEKNLYIGVGGVCIWKDMEAEAGMGRRWQSLKEHFHKQILPNIEHFELSSSIERHFCELRNKTF